MVFKNSRSNNLDYPEELIIKFIGTWTLVLVSTYFAKLPFLHVQIMWPVRRYSMPLKIKKISVIKIFGGFQTLS